MDILDIPRSSRESRRATSSRRREFPNNQEYRTTNLGDPYDYERAYVGSTRYGEFDPRQDDDRPYYDFDGPPGDFDYQSRDRYTPGYISRGYGEDEECDPGVPDDYGYGRSGAYGRSTYSYGYSADVDQARQYSYKQGSSRRTGRTSGSYARGYDEGPSRGTPVDDDYQPGSSVPSTEEMWMWSPSERNWVVVSHLHDTGNSTGCHLIRLSLVKLLGYSRSKDINKNDVHNLDTIGGPVSTLGSIRIAYITSTHKDEQQEAKFHVFDSNRASGYDVIFATGSADGGPARRDLWTITHGKRKLPNEKELKEARRRELAEERKKQRERDIEQEEARRRSKAGSSKQRYGQDEREQARETKRSERRYEDIERDSARERTMRGAYSW